MSHLTSLIIQNDELSVKYAELILLRAESWELRARQIKSIINSSSFRGVRKHCNVTTRDQSEGVGSWVRPTGGTGTGTGRGRDGGDCIHLKHFPVIFLTLAVKELWVEEKEAHCVSWPLWTRPCSCCSSVFISSFPLENTVGSMVLL